MAPAGGVRKPQWLLDQGATMRYHPIGPTPNRSSGSGRIFIVNEKANALVKKMRAINAQAAAVAESCSDEQWKLPVVDEDGRPVGVVFHHIAYVFPTVVEWATMIANDKPLPAFGRDELHAYNAQHAAEHVKASKEDVLALLAKVTDEAAEQLHSLSDLQLSKTTPIELAGGKEFSGEWVVQAFSISHAENHLAAIKATLGKT
jgi:hypothetical protein